MPDAKKYQRIKKRYPANWKDIADEAKAAARWRCVRCGHLHEVPAQRLPCDERCVEIYHPGGLNDGRQRVLTVHHLDGDPGNNAWWNLAALCQVCHLTVQAAWHPHQSQLVIPDRWLWPYIAGYEAARRGQELPRAEAADRMKEILSASCRWYRMAQ